MSYIFSKLTLKYYSLENGIYTIVPIDDANVQYNEMMLDYDAIEQVESLPFELNVVVVPEQLSRMKFIIQVFLRTGIKYEDIVLFIQNLAFDEAQKYVILTRLRSATHFDRNSSDLLTIAAMMGISSEQLDNIFINGNLIE